MKSANARSGPIPANSVLLWGLIWTRRHTDDTDTQHGASQQPNTTWRQRHTLTTQTHDNMAPVNNQTLHDDNVTQQTRYKASSDKNAVFY